MEAQAQPAQHRPETPGKKAFAPRVEAPATTAAIASAQETVGCYAMRLASDNENSATKFLKYPWLQNRADRRRVLSFFTLRLLRSSDQRGRRLLKPAPSTEQLGARPRAGKGIFWTASGL